MSPFSTKMTRTDPKELMFVMLIPIGLFAFVALLYLRDNPGAAFRSYQKSLSSGDWDRVIELSDQTTTDYLVSLENWIWNGGRKDVEQLEPFQQFLVFTTRCYMIENQRATITREKLLGIWLHALQLDDTIRKTAVRNRYNFGEKSIGQLYLKATNRSTALKIHFIKESKWRIQSINLLKEVYLEASLVGNEELLRSSNRGYFEQGHRREYLKPLKFRTVN